MSFDFECFSSIQTQMGVFSAGRSGQVWWVTGLMHGTEDLPFQQSYQRSQVEVGGYMQVSSGLLPVSCHKSCLFPSASLQQLLPWNCRIQNWSSSSVITVLCWWGGDMMILKTDKGGRIPPHHTSFKWAESGQHLPDLLWLKRLQICALPFSHSLSPGPPGPHFTAVRWQCSPLQRHYKSDYKSVHIYIEERKDSLY